MDGINWDGATFQVGMVRGGDARCAICGTPQTAGTEAWVRPVGVGLRDDDIIDRWCARDIQRGTVTHASWTGAR